MQALGQVEPREEGSHGVVDQEITEQREEDGHQECRTGEHTARQAVHFRKGVIRST